MWARLSEGNPVKAMTFVSHCWNERFSDFVATLNSLPFDFFQYLFVNLLPKKGWHPGLLQIHASPEPTAAHL